MKVCSVEGCNEKHRAKGFCLKHYDQIRYHGHILDTTEIIRNNREPNEFVIYDTYAEIVLYDKQGIEVARALIDLDQVDKCKPYRWYLHKSSGYVVSKINGKSYPLHRFIMNVHNEKYDYNSNCIDHKNRNPLDNRVCNLRKCSQQQNSMNQSLRKNNTSGTIGVFWDNTHNKWIATICANGKKNRKSFDKIENAIECRKQWEIEYFGEFVSGDNIE